MVSEPHLVQTSGKQKKEKINWNRVMFVSLVFLTFSLCTVLSHSCATRLVPLIP
jgi:hypothetical protein